MEVAIARDGIVSALVLWFDLILDDEIVASTSPFVPEERALCYGQGVVYLQPSEARVRVRARVRGLGLGLGLGRGRGRGRSANPNPCLLYTSPSPRD